MAKATLKINDDFVFCFSKNTVGYTDSIRQIPEFVSKYFVENVSTNFLLFDEEFWNADYVEMSRLVSKNLASTSAYFLEVELSFSGKKIGGINYKPKYSKESKVKVSFVDFAGETDEDLFLKFHVEAELFWDYKSSDHKKQVAYIEKSESSWEESKVQIRLNFRNNSILIDSMIYDENGRKLAQAPVATIDSKTTGFPEDENNLCFILSITPNVFSLVNKLGNDDKPNSVYPHIDLLQNKKIQLTSKYLNF
jgi:hypothetical protein